MFHKPAQIKPYAAIKGSERKSLVARIEQQAQTELTPEQKSALVPKSMQSAKCILKSGTKAQIYAAEGIPYFVSLGDVLVPTVYVLAATNAPIVPVVSTVPNTLKFLVSGADFMVPGIFGEQPHAPVGSPVQIRTLDGHLLATGLALVDIHSVSPEAKGKAVQIVNVRGDTLVGEDKLRGLAATVDTSVSTEDAIAGASGALDAETDGKAGESVSESAGDIPITQQEADDAFLYAAPRVFATRQEYPMPSATFAKLLAENMPYDHPELLIKNTSWKKLPKFIKHLEKENMLVARERQGDTIIDQLAAELEALVVDAPEQQKPKPAKKEKIQVVIRYKLKSSAAEIAPTNPYYSASQIKQLLSQYIAEHKLQTKADVTIDDALRKACGLKQDVETLITGKVVEEFVKHSTTAYHQINRADGEPGKLTKGQIPHIIITTERKGGNKVVTKVTGMESFGFEAKPFAEHLRVACAGSTTVGETKAGKNTKPQPIVQIQGDHVAKISQYLEKEGVKSSWIKR